MTNSVAQYGSVEAMLRARSPSSLWWLDQVRENKRARIEGRPYTPLAVFGRKVDVSENKACVHAWKFYKQTVRPEKVAATLPSGHDRLYLGGNWFFTVKACDTCHEKHYLDYKPA